MSAGRDDLNSRAHEGIVLGVGDGASCDRLLAHGEGSGGHAALVHQLPDWTRGALHATVQERLEMALVDEADYPVARSATIDE
jgi:hypothetical protein